MIRVCHVIDGLGVGGAEVMLENLVRTMDRSRFSNEVISLTDIGPIGQRIRATGVPVRGIGLRPDVRGALPLVRLPAAIRRARPDVVQTWLYQADLFGGISARLARRGVPVVWGLHRSDLDAEWTKRRLAVAARLSALASTRIPARIVCCSYDAAQRHTDLGYRSDRIQVIPNGFDTTRFAPDPPARAAVRAELELAPDAPLVGMVARFDPQKDHATFVAAASRVLKALPDAHFLLCGREVELAHPGFRAIAMRHPELDGHLHALGLRSDIDRIDAALDVFVLSSVGGEAFPLAIGEAMASGVPCVATDVGDAAELIGPTGRVVPRRDAAALAGAVIEVLTSPAQTRRQLGAAARHRVQERFDLHQIVGRYEALYESLVR